MFSTSTFKLENIFSISVSTDSLNLPGLVENELKKIVKVLNISFVSHLSVLKGLKANNQETTKQEVLISVFFYL